MSECWFVAWELPNLRDQHDVDEGDVDIDGVEMPFYRSGAPSARDRHNVDEGDVNMDGVEMPLRRSGAPKRMRQPRC